MKKFALLFGLATVLLFSCKNEDLCTEEFKTVYIGILGAELDTFFTVRTAQSDTIFYDNSTILSDKFYPVLNDSYHDKIKGSQDNFIFVGINSDTTIIENFVIGSDGCHVLKVTGPVEVDLTK